MDMQIGNRIKQLRKEKSMTQERLAELLGISFQAVSKWENNIAMPDITLVPRLARIFGVSTDELFAYNLQEIENDIKSYAERSYKLRESEPDKARKILEEGLRKYPENFVLLNNLLYVINYSKNPDETIKIAGKLIDKATESDIRYDALRFLAYAYNAKGDTEAAVAALNQIPEIYFTKLSETAFVLTGRPMYEAAEKQKWISFETLLQMIWKTAEYFENAGEHPKAVKETERALALIELFKDEEKINNFSNYAEFFTKALLRLKNNR